MLRLAFIVVENLAGLCISHPFPRALSFLIKVPCLAIILCRLVLRPSALSHTNWIPKR